MREKILEALKTKFEGVSDAILGRVADKLAKTATSEEEVTTAVEGVTFQKVLESYGDSRATEAQQTAVANYEKKLKEGKKKEPQQEPSEDKAEIVDDVPAWAKALMESNKALSEKIAAFEGEKTANGRKSKLEAALSSAPEKIRNRYRKDFERLSFKDDEDFNDWLGEVTPEIESITNDFNAKGGVVTRTRGGGGKGSDEIDPNLKARVEERKTEKATSVVSGLPN